MYKETWVVSDCVDRLRLAEHRKRNALEKAKSRTFVCDLCGKVREHAHTFNYVLLPARIERGSTKVLKIFCILIWTSSVALIMKNHK